MGMISDTLWTWRVGFPLALQSFSLFGVLANAALTICPCDLYRLDYALLW
jgi:hypothetical protein